MEMCTVNMEIMQKCTGCSVVVSISPYLSFFGGVYVGDLHMMAHPRKSEYN